MSFRSQDHRAGTSATSVQRRIHLDLIDGMGRSIDLTAGFHYDAADPFAVTLTFYTDGPEVTWSFARDLLVEGLTQPSGAGDVHVWPSEAANGRALTVIELQSPGGQALLQAPAAAIAAFVDASLEIVASGEESSQLDLDALVDELLAV